MMKAISLHQPWATLIALREKRIETRGRRISHRGEIAIHAARRWTLDQALLLHQEPFRQALAYHGITADNVVHDLMPRGAIVAVAELIDDVDLSCGLPLEVVERFEVGTFEGKFGNYGRGRRGYLLKNIRKINPVLCRGMQAIPFDVPADVEALVREQLRRTV